MESPGRVEAETKCVIAKVKDDVMAAAFRKYPDDALRAAILGTGYSAGLDSV